ncbi:MAG TPA: hypothetical protein VF178_03995 [Gemmatimonadaceae bacterium]
MTGHALRYVWWQVRDRAGQRTLVCVIIALAFSIPVFVAGRDGNLPPDAGTSMLRAMFAQLSLIFALVLGGGLIANDRRQGWYRFYLAKPVSPVWFYGQSIVLAVLGMVVASLAFVAIFSRALRVSWSWHPATDGLLMFALVGMTVIFWSALVRRDWLAGLVTYMVVIMLRDLLRRGDSVIGDVGNVILPPMHLVGRLRPLTTTEVVWIVSWAVLLFAATLVLLRIRPLGED